jgi:hypothetical protein
METTMSDALYAGGVWMLDRERPLDAAHFFRAMLLAAPADERGWLGLGTCHERLDQDVVAFDIFLAGTVAAERKVRCMLAVARALRKNGEEAKAERVLEEAAALAVDEGLALLVEHERSAA